MVFRGYIIMSPEMKVQQHMDYNVFGAMRLLLWNA